MERIALSLIITARKLCPYFQAYTICISTDLPLRKVLQKPNLSGRLIQWSLELGEIDLLYFPHTAIKGQAVANFLLDFAKDSSPAEGDDPHIYGRTWTVIVDDSSNQTANEAGVVLTSPRGWR